MVAFPSFSLILGLSSLFFGGLASPVPEDKTGNATNVVPLAVPSAPRWVIYSDKFVSGLTGPPPVSQVRGFNVFALSFLLTEGAFDKAEEWTQLSASERTQIKSDYHAAGIQLIVSLFGATDAPTSSGADPIATANTMAAWVKEFDLDGADIDYEDFNAMNAGNGSAEKWLSDFTRQMRALLPKGQFILTHAPVAPWFSPEKFNNQAYLAVDAEVGSLIDWYNVQFYNQGTSEYTTCSGLLTQSSATWPHSSLFEIAQRVSLNKLVIGKPATQGDASNGFMTTSLLASCLQQAKGKGWSAGAMVWEFPDAAASWIQAVRSLSFPV
ncbi:hypothetical protein E1B28_007340 [Marasmius oreades]|uniref:GH18 domain-containing protein n=1 Tax=Marasmius oreades TaxID=181124 RepID=A0A9P7S241_9AGAR|nr:uncharacterized protein E1B28_007340 [Marasmius oreades]KAG7093682.1 hypothetical protein E1B28_007340 [Marasmius oreades]